MPEKIFCERELSFRVVTTNQKARSLYYIKVSQKYENELEGLFIKLLKICTEAKMLKVGTIALDRTKVEANAFLSSNRTEKYLEAEVKMIF